MNLIVKNMICIKKFGFHEDGFLRKQYFYEGKWWGAYILSLLEEEYDQN